MRVALVILLGLGLVSCEPNQCIEETYLNGQLYSTFTYSPNVDGGCYCEEYTYVVAGDVWRTRCAAE